MAEFQGEHAELTHRIIKVFYDVARELGFGFLETVYQRSMMVALEQAGFTVEEQVEIPVHFRGQLVGVFLADIVVERLIVLELKTSDEISKAQEAQALHYLRSSTMEVGYVLAFGQKPKFQRVIMQNDRKPNLKLNPC